MTPTSSVTEQLHNKVPLCDILRVCPSGQIHSGDEMSARLQATDNPVSMPHIPGYRIVRVIGHGGMSTVYLGIQPSLSREVAIKVMRPEVLADEVSRRRFENEARTIARLEHPHIVSIHEVGRTAEGQPWYSMPYLGRGHLGQRDLTRDHVRVREILEALLSALSFAHARGVIHRDVKAENVLFDDNDRPLLADFGIALRRGHGTRVTLTGLAIGSTAYMAPEQARGQQVDHRADLYGLGVLAWEMLTGQLPYQAEDAVAMAVAHVHTPLPGLPPGLRHWQRFMDKALAKLPHKRFHDAEYMQSALRAVGGQQPRWRWLADSGIDFLRAHRALAWTGAGVVGISMIGLLLSLVRTPEIEMGARAADLGLILPTDAVTPTSEPPADVSDLPEHEDESVTASAPAQRRLRTAPTSPANQRLEQMKPLLANPSPTVEQFRQAVDLLLAAHQADPEHLQLPEVRNTLLRRLAAQVATAIADGDDARAQALLWQLPRIRGALPPSRQALATLQETVHAAIVARIQDTSDVQVVLRNLDTARLAGLSPKQTGVLLARARVLQPPPGWITLELGGRSVFVSHVPVSRADYARFAESTGRPPASCRVSASPLRLLAPRDWTRPGFEQGEHDPVVCVSWRDASDYAAWAGERDGRQYRLPSVNEAAALPAAIAEQYVPEDDSADEIGADDDGAARALAEWRSNCQGQDCSRRIASGRSWRSRRDQRPLLAARGYRDVGFRLALDRPALSVDDPAPEIP